MDHNNSAPVFFGSSIPHRVRVSKRARRIGLRVLPGVGLEVVLPAGTNPDCVPGVLGRYRSWIERALGRMRISGGAPEEPVKDKWRSLPVPECFSLKGGREVIIIGEDSMPDPPPVVPGGRIGPPPLLRRVVPPRGRSREDTLAWLREWVRAEAREYLGSSLARLATAHGFSYAKLSVRFQRTRWGSCSHKGNISLNAGLLFLPENLARYIVLHELCHTRVLNHSQAFWKILFSVEPDALELDRAMRRAWKYVPHWVFAA